MSLYLADTIVGARPTIGNIEPCATNENIITRTAEQFVGPTITDGRFEQGTPTVIGSGVNNTRSVRGVDQNQ